MLYIPQIHCASITGQLWAVHKRIDILRPIFAYSVPPGPFDLPRRRFLTVPSIRPTLPISSLWL